MVKKPWTPGSPTRDHLGQLIVFFDDWDRYVVDLVRDNGAHARRPMGDPRFAVLPKLIEGRAPTFEEAEEIALASARALSLSDLRPLGGGKAPTGGYFVRYSYGGPPLD